MNYLANLLSPLDWLWVALSWILFSFLWRDGRIDRLRQNQTQPMSDLNIEILNGSSNKPTNAKLRLNAVELSDGDRFTQADIDSGRVTLEREET